MKKHEKVAPNATLKVFTKLLQNTLTSKRDTTFQINFLANRNIETPVSIAAYAKKIQGRIAALVKLAYALEIAGCAFMDYNENGATRLGI